MKKHLIITTIALSLFSCGEAQTKSDKTSTTQSEQTDGTVNKVVTKSEFKELLKKEDVQLIDVRTPEEYSAGHIGDAKNIDFYATDFKANMSKLDKEKPVLIYCKSGGRSGQTAEMLKELGFKEVYDLEGGYSGWE